MVYLATLNSSMVLTGSEAGNAWVGCKGWMRGGPRRSEGRCRGRNRAVTALACGRVVRDEYNLDTGHAVRDRIAVP
jgi:hypothetical protein